MYSIIDEVHLTVLKGIIQLRPCLRHIERLNESGRQTGGGGGVVSDGDTTATESEEEEAKPITVCFLSPSFPSSM